MLTDVEGMATENLVWERDRGRRQIKEKQSYLEVLEAELGRRGYVPEALEVVEKKGGNGRWLHLERVRCGKARCKKCADGPGHGPYYYLYLTNPNTGRYTSKYLGKPSNLTEEVRQEFGVEVEEDQAVEG
jgi:hypothetical protein